MGRAPALVIPCQLHNLLPRPPLVEASSIKVARQCAVINTDFTKVEIVDIWASWLLLSYRG